jgi:hypothetical protein
MSKQILNQRYCYRINSNFIDRNKGKVKIPNISKGIKQRYIVGIGDSEGTRMIRDILNSEYNEEYINNKKSELKQKRKEIIKDRNNTELKKEIRQLQEDIRVASLQDFICNVEFNSNKQYDKYSESGFELNGKKYELLLGTPGGLKKSVVLFIRSDLLEEMEIRLNNGANFLAEKIDKSTGEIKTVEVLPNKIMGYKALTFSSSTPVTWTNRILVVKDVETEFNADVIEVKFDKELGEPNTFPVNNKLIKLNACDGCGLISYELAEKWANDLQEDYIPSSFCIRNSWIKGMVTKFKFKEYCKEVLKTTQVTDVFGQVHNIDDVDIILNESMLKLNFPFYKSIEEYCDNCLKNEYGFSVTKYTPKVLENERMLNYQYIQCLDLNDNDIDKLLNKNISEIKEVIGKNYKKSILFGKGKDITEENVWFGNDINDYHIKALMINKNTIHDDFVVDKLKRAISKRIDMLKTGKIKVNGNYQIAIGEPVIQLEAMCNKKPQGLLNTNEFYIKYWKDRNIEKVGAFRSPMSCKQNARVMNICNKQEVDNWYSDIENMIIFNAWDTSCMAMNGEDFDADMNFTTSNSIIINGIFDLPALDCDSESAEKMVNPQRKDYIQAIKNSFGNKVGSVTNVGSSFYDKLSLFLKGSKEYIELDRRIQCIQYIQQSCIDSAKQGKPPEPIPSYWYDNKCEYIKINMVRQKKNDKFVGNINLSLDSEEIIKGKEYLLSICAYKKPYYFRYIYGESNNEYLNYIKEANILCLREFRMTLDELINKNNKSLKEQEMLKYYLEKNPLSDNPCIVNKIAHKVEVSFEGDLSDNDKNLIDKKFDYSIYMSNEIENVDNQTINKIKDIYSIYKSSISNKRNVNDENSDKEVGMEESKQNFDSLKVDLKNLIMNEQELCDKLVFLAYKKKLISKAFVWSMVGNYILENLLDNSNRTISFPIRDDNGDIKYDGDNFKMVTKIIDKKEDK